VLLCKLIAGFLTFVPLAGLTLAAAAPRPVSAKVAEPVLPELMGGCSMKCSFAWSAEVITAKGAQPARALNDERAETAWIADGPGSGVGAKLRLAFPKKIPTEMDGETPFYGLDLINGHWKTEDLWRRYARLKKARLLYNGRPLCDVTFADSRRWQSVIFPDIMVRSGDALTFEVLEIYPGEKNGVAISEIVLQGAH